MNLAHLHLLLNHFPTIGMVVGLGLFLAALVRKNEELKRASLVIFLGIAILAIPTYMSGNAAEEAICVTAPDKPCSNPEVSKALIETHEGAALIAMIGMEFSGAFAWLGLWQYRRTRRFPNATMAAVLLLSLVTFGLMARAADIGGEIRHPEILAANEKAAVGEPIAREVGVWVTSPPWMWPTCETLHFVGLCLLFGVATLVDLRVLGLMKGISFPALHRILPWGILGFGINLITGILFFVADPGQYTQNIAFQWKIFLIMLAGINVVYFTLFEAPWRLEAGDDAPLLAKFVAATAILLVFGVMYFGRMLPFLGNSF
jgi:uncharacterized membrane protein